MQESTAHFRFDAGLRELLTRSRRGLDEFPIGFKESPAVKHLIESSGVPHTEVGGLQANGATAGLGYHVQPGDRVEVFSVPDGGGKYPGLESPWHGEGDSLKNADGPRFIADNHLGRLAAYLRMLGLDTLYRNDYQDEELAQVSAREGRVLLTRDRRLLMRSQVLYGCCLRSALPVSSWAR